tara:strand:+ start:113 stop:589 length:477 start_codon:yes stop_codon:yes gene_type:complete
MGAVQSVIYPNDEQQRLLTDLIPEISTKKRTKGTVEYIVGGVPEMHVIEEHFDYQLDKLKAYINMYFLYDGYDNKNSVILKDLEKKFVNQKKELKLLFEKKDKLRSDIDYSKGHFENEKKKNKIMLINIFILVVISIVFFVFIVKNLRAYVIINSNIN